MPFLAGAVVVVVVKSLAARHVTALREHAVASPVGE